MARYCARPCFRPRSNASRRRSGNRRPWHWRDRKIPWRCAGRAPTTKPPCAAGWAGPRLHRQCRGLIHIKEMTREPRQGWHLSFRRHDDDLGNLFPGACMRRLRNLFSRSNSGHHARKGLHAGIGSQEQRARLALPPASGIDPARACVRPLCLREAPFARVPKDCLRTSLSSRWPGRFPRCGH
jgi:hypothetical protein